MTTNIRTNHCMTSLSLTITDEQRDRISARLSKIRLPHYFAYTAGGHQLLIVMQRDYVHMTNEVDRVLDQINLEELAKAFAPTTTGGTA